MQADTNKHVFSSSLRMFYITSFQTFSLLFSFVFLFRYTCASADLLEELLVSGLFLGKASSSLGLDGIELVDNKAISRGELVSGLEIGNSSILVLDADVGEASAVEGLGSVGVGDARDSKSRGGAADAVCPVLELHAEKGRVVVEGESEGIEGRLGAGGLVVEVRVFVEVSQALLVLFKAEVQVARLEGLVAKVLAGAGDLEDLLGGQGLLLGGEVIGEVLVRVAGGVGLLGVGGKGLVAGQLTAVGNEDLLLGLIAGSGAQVLDLADNRLAVEDFAKDNVLAVEVGCGHGGDEELGAVGV